MKKKTIGILLTAVCVLILALDIYNGIQGNYQYDRDYGSYWNLAEKASTITKKTEGIDAFVKALDNSSFKGKYNAVNLTTPDNGFDQNFEALKSLQLRLHEIAGMDVTSFQYQTAIQQITQQEQGEAKAMLNVFEGIYWKEYHFMLWNWVGWVQVLSVVALLVFGIILWINGASDDY